MTSKRIVIHIGCHKTGTTSIQRCLARNEAALARAGMTYFYKNRLSGANDLPDLHSWLAFTESKKVVPHGLHVISVDLLMKELERIPGDIVVSSENFSFLFEEKSIRGFADALLQTFSNVTIVCYIRRQDRHVVSHHQEGSKLRRVAENDLFGSSTRAIPPYQEKHRLYLDYNHRLSMWADAFGDANLIVRIYDRALLQNADVVDDFFNLLGLKKYARVPDRNLSLGFRQIKFGHILNVGDFENRQAVANLISKLGHDPRKLLPSRDQAIAYYRNFTESNASLNQRFHISPMPSLFDNNFSDYPESAEDLWTEDSANDALAGIFALVDLFLSALPPNRLRKVLEAVDDGLQAHDS